MKQFTQILEKLNDALLNRDIQVGSALLGQLTSDLEALDNTAPDAMGSLLCVAQWVDLGYGNLAFLERLVITVDRRNLGRLPLSSYIDLRLTEAYLAFAHEDPRTAISILDFVLRAEAGIVEPRTIALAHFWKARSHRTQGDYALALKHIVDARQLASFLNASKFEAELKIHESWLHFQRGQKRDALRLLNEAELELCTTGHDQALGNIESSRGRFARRSGEYSRALAHFEQAVSIYSQRFAQHPCCARALVNSAYVKRLIALDLKGRSRSGRAKAAQHAQYLAICSQALDLLGQAGQIYNLHNHHAGKGAVYVNAGYIHLDSGDIDRAENEACKAFALGTEVDDLILRARARTLQSAVQNERAEEQLAESTDLTLHAALAKDYAEEAVALAKQTENRRLLAGAYISVSVAAANDFYKDWNTAKHFASLAESLLDNDDRDHLSRELAEINARILKSTEIDEMLRRWSDGIISQKTFQQVIEEFSQVVIPRVWLREGKNTSRVAERLSMSPKKIRRILKSAHVSKEGE